MTCRRCARRVVSSEQSAQDSGAFLSARKEPVGEGVVSKIAQRFDQKICVSQLCHMSASLFPPGSLPLCLTLLWACSCAAANGPI